MKTRRIRTTIAKVVFFLLLETIALVLLMVPSCADVEISKENFPDKGFREYVEDNYDLNGDGVLQEEEIEAVKDMSDVGCFGTVKDLRGIEYLTSVETLVVLNIPLKELDISNNTKLTNLEINNLGTPYKVQLKKIDISNNTALENLRIYEVSISELDISNNQLLDNVSINFCPLKSLNVSNNTKLTWLNPEHNKNLRSIDLNKNTKLQYFLCNDCGFESIDVTHNPALKYIDCSHNLISELDFSQNEQLNFVDCSYNHIEHIDVSHNLNLEYLRFNNNRIKCIDISNNTKIDINDPKRFSYEKNNGITIIQDPSQVLLSIVAENDVRSVCAGQSLKLMASFHGADAVQKNNTVNWSLKDVHTGLTPTNITISKQGVLKANTKIDERTEIEVTAYSEIFKTSDSMLLSVTPAVGTINIEPKEAVVYFGANDVVNIDAVVEPADVDLNCLNWKSSDERIAYLTDHGDGTVTIYPVSTGKCTISVKEPNGKSAKMMIAIKEPVLGVEISMTGSATPGSSIKAVAKIKPANSTDKTVKWSLGVDESIATIDANGKITIKKDTPSGTKINVTCEAIGAPVPVTESTEIVVQ